jgi:hypothetical protein
VQWIVLTSASAFRYVAIAFLHSLPCVPDRPDEEADDIDREMSWLFISVSLPQWAFLLGREAEQPLDLPEGRLIFETRHADAHCPFPMRTALAHFSSSAAAPSTFEKLHVWRAYRS